MLTDALDVQISDKELRRLFKVFRLQVPFAIAAALTKTAHDMNPDMRESLSRSLKVRNRGLPRAAFGPRSIIRAEKRDYPNSRAILGVPDDAKFQGGFLRDHVTGARRKSERGGRLAIPTDALKRNARGRFAKSKTPSGILARKAGFLFEDGSRASIGLRKGARAKDRRETQYLLRRSVRIREAWPFQEHAAGSFEDHYALAIRVKLLQAIKTAKKGKSKTNARLLKRNPFRL